MKSKKRGKNTSEAEVLRISQQGVWVHVRGKEFFMPYKEFPWFKKAKASQIRNLQLFHRNHLRWNELDIDLHLDSLKNPAKYRLKYR